MDELIKRLRNEAETERYLLPHSDNGTAALLDEAADAIEELTRENESLAKSVNEASEILRKRWIPVEERLPEEETPVQVTYLGYHDKKPHTDVLACLYYGYWCYWDGAPCSYDKCSVEVTHWMPLLPAPKEE